MSGLEVLAAVQTVIALSSRIYSFFSPVNDAPGEVRQMCTQLQLLQKLFPEVGRSSSNLANASRLSLDIIFVCLKGCESEFNTLRLAVEPFRAEEGLVWKEILKKAASSVRWILKTEEFEKLTGNLEKTKQSFALAMLVAGMKVDTAVLEGLAVIGAKVEENGRQLESHLEDVHAKISSQLEQFEYRFLQKVDVLSRKAAESHSQSDLRITELVGNINSDGQSQADSLLTTHPSGSREGSAVLNVGPTNTSSYGEPTIRHVRGNTISHALQDIEQDSTVLALSHNAKKALRLLVKERGKVDDPGRDSFKLPDDLKLTLQETSIDLTKRHQQRMMIQVTLRAFISVAARYQLVVLEAALSISQLIQRFSYYGMVSETLIELQDIFDLAVESMRSTLNLQSRIESFNSTKIALKA